MPDRITTDNSTHGRMSAGGEPPRDRPIRSARALLNTWAARELRGAERERNSFQAEIQQLRADIRRLEFHIQQLKNAVDAVVREFSEPTQQGGNSRLRDRAHWHVFERGIPPCRSSLRQLKRTMDRIAGEVFGPELAPMLPRRLHEDRRLARAIQRR